MQAQRGAAIALFCAATLIAIVSQTAGRDRQLQALASRFETANRAEDIEPMLALYYLQGSDQASLSRLKSALNAELGLPIAAIEFEPLSGASEESIDFAHNGIAYGPSLPPRHKMRVIYAVEDQLSSLYTIGTSPSGEWRIITAKPYTTTTD
jgi:hypothetical protein